jgi:cellulose synthase/poly-beta-1,6-N-acetylglucosamine synthase-like glycosyltransferase
VANPARSSGRAARDGRDARGYPAARVSLLSQALWTLLLVPAVLQAVHRLRLLAVYARTRGDTPEPPALPADLPHVTVQLPVYNERDVIVRLVAAVGRLAWPADRLQVQLLDDSTDDTAARAATDLDALRARGVEVEVLRRADRDGFKAGALAAALPAARGALVAVFDADFLPPPSFLRDTVPWFADPGVGMVQARWGHLNAEARPLTAAQSVLLDGHFVIEHTARHRGGDWFNFNGTAGVWRRSAIDASGGWQADTLTEDIDLSYRAQLGGWRFVYLPDVVVPAELPDSMDAFRAQQARWAKGTTEVLRKLGARVLRAEAPLATRMEALSHLGANLAWLPTVASACLLPVAVLLGADGLTALPWLTVALLGANALFYLTATGGRRPWRVALALGLAMAISLAQATAVIEALRGRRTAFVRTPKRGEGEGSYAPRAGKRLVRAGEGFLCALNVSAAVTAVLRGDPALGVLPALLAASFAAALYSGSGSSPVPSVGSTGVAKPSVGSPSALASSTTTRQGR